MLLNPKYLNVLNKIIVIFDELKMYPRFNQILFYFFRIIHKAFISVNSFFTWVYILGPLVLCMRGKPTLPARVWYPYVTDNPYLFWLSFIQISLLLLYVAHVQFATQLIFIGLLIQVRTQLQLLGCRIKQFLENENLMNRLNLSKSDAEKVEIKLIKELIRDEREILR